MELFGILLDIRSMHNVGSMFRTADGVGIKKLYLCGITPEPTDRFGNIREDFKKTALHAEETVMWEKRKSVSTLIRRLKKEGWHIVAIEQSPDAISFKRFRKKNFKKCVMIVGNEVDGIPQSVLKNVDTILEIPMRGNKESLNVSVAFGISAYAIHGQCL